MPWATKIHCTQCGSLVTNEAKYCAKCGNPVGEALPERTTEAPVVPVGTKIPRMLLVYVVAVMSLGVYAAMFIPAMSGQAISRGSSQSAMIITSLLFFLSWRRLGRKGWHGALLGAVVGLALSSVAHAIYGFMRHTG